MKVIPGRPPYTADAASLALIDRAVAIYAGLGQKLLVGPGAGAAAPMPAMPSAPGCR